LRVFPEPSERCPCRSGRSFEQCCKFRVERAYEDVRRLCPGPMELPFGEQWLQLVGLILGLNPDPMPDRVKEVAEAQNRLLEAFAADTPDDYDRIRAKLSSFITPNPNLRLYGLDCGLVTARAINEAVTPALQRDFFAYLYTLYRLFIDDPAALTACALASCDMIIDGPPARTLVWTTVLRMRNPDLYRDYVDWCFSRNASNARRTGTRRVLRALARGEIKLEIPSYAVAYGALYVQQNAPEVLDEVVAVRAAAASRGGSAEARQLASAIDGSALGQIGDCLLESFEIESEHFLPIFVDRLSDWFYATGYPRGLWSLKLLEEVYHLLELLAGPQTIESGRLARLVYVDAVTRFVLDGGLQELSGNLQAIEDLSKFFESREPSLSAHLQWVYQQFVEVDKGHVVDYATPASGHE